MKVVVKDNRRFVLRFDKDEEVIQGLAKFMKDQEILACTFTGIGAVASVDLGYFNEFIKDYRKKPFIDHMELVSLTGNGGLKDGEPNIHAHGVFGKTDFTLIGGHVFKMVVSVTAEIFLIKLEGNMTRTLNADFNLSLLS